MPLKRPTFKSPEHVNFSYTAVETLQVWFCDSSRPGGGQRNLDYPGGANLLPCVFKSREALSVVENQRHGSTGATSTPLAGLENRGRQPRAEECGKPLEAGKGKVTDSIWSLQKGTQASQHLAFSPVTVTPISDLRECKISCCFKLLQLFAGQK